MRLLRQLDIDVIAVDSNPQRLADAKDSAQICCATIDEALACQPEVAFVCTSPLSHHEIVKKLLEAGVHVFSELNLVNQGYDELISIAGAKKLIAFPSSTWLYRKEMQYITSEVGRHGGTCVYTYHIGQYLPDWHPWESYNSYFIGSAKTNACREILALELPWLIKAFGPIVEVNSVSRRLTSLNIDYDDTRMVRVRHESGHIGSLLVDVASPVAIRSLEVVGEKLQIFWAGQPDTLFAYDPVTGEKRPIKTYDAVSHQSGYASNIIENAYMDEIRAFLSQVEGEAQPEYTLADDGAVLQWIDEIEGQ